MRRRVGRGLLIAMCLGMAGCDEALSDLTGPTPNLQPTFSSIQREIFSMSDSSGRAACTQCHNPANRLFAGVLDLTAAAAYDELVGMGSRLQRGSVRVVPGEPDSSYLIRKLEGAPGIFGSRMPLGPGPFLTEGQILVIRRWIAEGAPNN